MKDKKQRYKREEKFVKGVTNSLKGFPVKLIPRNKMIY